MDEPTPTPRYMGSLAAVLERRAVGDANLAPAASDAQAIALDVDLASLTAEGTLQAAAAELQRLRSTMHFTAVALAPIQTRSADGDANAPVSFFAIDPKFGTRADLRAFVATMKSIGVDVWMRFVLTQTGEGTDASPRSESLRGIDAATYFQLGSSGGLDSAGVPMTTALNPCSAPTISLLVDALRTFTLIRRCVEFHNRNWRRHRARTARPLATFGNARVRRRDRERPKKAVSHAERR